MGVLDRLIDLMILLPSDAEKMRDRGFNDVVIERKRWRSCTPNNIQVLKELEKEFGVDELVKEKLYVTDTYSPGKWTINPQLVEERVLIPYVDGDGNVVKVRPHKKGFHEQGAMVYRPESSFKRALTCIVTESEFKADAAECFGYSAIGIPGITSMSGKNLDYFRSVIDTIVAEEFVICFDNEIKDNPAFSNFKPDWRKRYETILYAYAMALRILEMGRNCKVATLPDEWMVDGKIDIDGALAQGKTMSEFNDVITQAVAPKKYIKIARIPEHHRPWINKRLRQFFYTSMIQVKNSCYWTKDSIDKDGRKVEGRKLTNCVIEIKNMYELIDSQGDGIKRDVAIIDEYGIESKLIPIKAVNMSTRTAFSTWLMSQGNYLVYAMDKDVTYIWEHIFSHDGSNIVYLVNRCGYIPEHNFWIFNNLIIKNGNLHHADDNGICWVDDVGYQIRVLTDSTILPSLRIKEPEHFNIDKYLQYLHDTVDSENNGLSKALFAWALAIAFSEDIFAEYHMFPILNVYGSKGGGKSTVVRWLTALYGQEAATKNLMGSTPVGVARSLSYYSSLPFVAEDWRDDPKCKNYIPLFLGVYNRQAGAKGIKNSFGLQEVEVRAALAILGEEMINDNGLASRCVSFYMPEDRIVERFDEMEDMIGEASSFMLGVIKDYDKHRDRVMKQIRIEAKKLEALPGKAERRTMFNYAILLGTYNAIMPEDKDFTSFVKKLVGEASSELKTGDKLHKFAEEFLFGVTEGLLQNYHYKFKGRHIILWVKGISDVMNKYYTRNMDQSRLVCKHFSQQSYYVGMLRATYNGARGKLPSIELDLDAMPDSIKHHFEGAYNVDTGSKGEEESDSTPQDETIVVVQDK